MLNPPLDNFMKFNERIVKLRKKSDFTTTEIVIGNKSCIVLLQDSANVVSLLV